MKKSWLFIMVIFGAVNVSQANNKLTKEQLDLIRAVQEKKIDQQFALARTPLYKMIDAVIKEDIHEGPSGIGAMVLVNWGSIFKILDSMQSTISVNEYRTFMFQYPLLWIAVMTKNFAAAKILLEKYGANPNIMIGSFVYDKARNAIHMTPLMFASHYGDLGMVRLLLHYGANPKIKNPVGKDSFDYAENNEIRNVLNQFRR